MRKRALKSKVKRKNTITKQVLLLFKEEKLFKMVRRDMRKLYETSKEKENNIKNQNQENIILRKSKMIFNCIEEPLIDLHKM